MIREFFERRLEERRHPLVTLTCSEAQAIILERRYTGSATVEFRNGVMQEIKIFSQPLRIRLDNRARQVDIAANELPDSRDSRC